MRQRIEADVGGQCLSDCQELAVLSCRMGDGGEVSGSSSRGHQTYQKLRASKSGGPAARRWVSESGAIEPGQVLRGQGDRRMADCGLGCGEGGIVGVDRPSHAHAASSARVVCVESEDSGAAASGSLSLGLSGAGD